MDLLFIFGYFIGFILWVVGTYLIIDGIQQYRKAKNDQAMDNKLDQLLIISEQMDLEEN